MKPQVYRLRAIDQLEISARTAFRRRIASRAATLAIAAASFVPVIFLAGCGDQFVGGKIESKVAECLPDIIGPADSYEVSVTGHAAKMISGKISQMTIHGKGVRLHQDFRVDDLVVEMKGVRFDTGSNQLTGTDETTFQVTLSDKSLTKYIAKRQPDLKQLKITMTRGKATVETRPTVLGVSAGVSLAGNLQLLPANKVNFVPDQISVAGLNMPGMVVDYVTKRINPVMDMSLANFPAEIHHLAVLNGEIRVSGTADLNHGMQVAQQGR
jgi:hypothetical protein